MYRTLLFFLHLPILELTQQLLGLRVQRLSWLPSYSLMRGPFFRHALSAPVSVIAGCLDASLLQPESNKHRLIQARTVCESVERLLASLTAERPVTQSFAVCAAVQECVQVCKILNPSVVITCQLACSRSLMLQGSAIHLQEALSCAIRNAAEAYGKDDSYRPVTVVMYQTKKSLRVEIIDCAAGMSAFVRLMSQLPGVSAKPTGTGLGLSFVRYVISQVFAGSVEIESTQGRGTRMRWVIPI